MNKPDVTAILAGQHASNADVMLLAEELRDAREKLAELARLAPQMQASITSAYTAVSNTRIDSVTISRRVEYAKDILADADELPKERLLAIMRETSDVLKEIDGCSCDIGCYSQQTTDSLETIGVGIADLTD